MSYSDFREIIAYDDALHQNKKTILSKIFNKNTTAFYNDCFDNNYKPVKLKKYFMDMIEEDLVYIINVSYEKDGNIKNRSRSALLYIFIEFNLYSAILVVGISFI